jgi:hypothetical protein
MTVVGGLQRHRRSIWQPECFIQYPVSRQNLIRAEDGVVRLVPQVEKTT